MAVPISYFVDVQVAVQAAPVAAPVLGIPLLFGFESELPTTPSYYAPDDILTSLEDLGVSTTDPVYVAAQAIKAQSSLGPLPDSIGVVKRLANVAQVIELVPTVVNSVEYRVSITIDGTTTPAAYTSDGSATLQEIVEGVAAAINTAMAASTVAATEDNTKVILTAEVAGVGFSVSATADGGATWTATETTANRNGATQLQDIYDADQSWYILVPLAAAAFNLPDQDLKQIGAAISGMEAVAFLQTAEADTLDIAVTDDPASLLEDALNSRVFVLYHEDTDEAAAAALAGRLGGYNPEDGLTPAVFKQLSGPTAQDLTSTELTGAKSKRANVYVKLVNRSTNNGGRIADGVMSYSLSWQQRIGVDWAVAEMRQAVFNLLSEASNAGRMLAINEAGLQAIGGEIARIGADMVRIGLISSAPTVTIPAVADLDPEDVAAGVVRGFRLSGTINDAVVYTYINAYLARAGA